MAYSTRLHPTTFAQNGAHVVAAFESQRRHLKRDVHVIEEEHVYSDHDVWLLRVLSDKALKTLT